MSRLQLAYVLLSVISTQLLSSASDVEKRVKSCVVLSSELIVTSSPPSSSSSSSSSATAAGGRVAINMTVYVACRNSSLVLSGSGQLTCQQDGSWDHNLPTCKPNSTYSESRRRCQMPPSHFANGVMTASSNSLTITYRCDDGHRMIGAVQLHCLPNNTWSAPPPRCVAVDEDSAWMAAFRDNVKWQGSYDYDGRPVQFALVVHSASDNVVKATLRGHVTQLHVELTGRRQNDYIVFNATRIVQHSSTMTSMTDWSVTGQLTKVKGHWVYSGIVASPQPGFLKLMMIPTTPTPADSQKESSSSDQLAAASLDYDHDDAPSSTALGLGVTIAIVAIVIAGGLAAFCAHRGAALRLSSHSAHQTLTSFENPIYDAGHVVVK